MAVNRPVIFAEVLARNAARRHAWLPPLDIRAEYDRTVAIAIDREMRALAERPQHRAALDRIVEEVRDEMLTKHGIKGETFGGRIAIGHRVAERSMAYLRAVYGAEAKPLPGRHPIRYAGAVDEYCFGQGAAGYRPVIEIRTSPDEHRISAQYPTHGSHPPGGGFQDRGGQRARAATITTPPSRLSPKGSASSLPSK